MAGTFTDQMTKLMPANMQLAPELVRTFDWLEEQGWMEVRPGGKPEDHVLYIYPPDVADHQNASFVSFGTVNQDTNEHWVGGYPNADGRIFEIAITSGDGGRAVIWLDDAGVQQYVHLGHDNAGVISCDPVVFLQFLAMGYVEPGGLDFTDVTPEQDALEYYGLTDPSEFGKNDPDEQPAIEPTAFRQFIETEFNVKIPETARALGIADFTAYGQQRSDDPFINWLISVTPPPTAEELAYIAKLEKMVEGLNIENLDIESLDFSELEPDPESKGLLDKLKGLFGSNK